MTKVRYVNKKTGTVAIYESTSHYDPVTKQSRPIRKYLGTEDPITKELIPSTGKKGRKKSSESKTSAKTLKPETDYKLLYENLKAEMAEKERIIKDLLNENRLLSSCLRRIRDVASEGILPQDTKRQ